MRSLSCSAGGHDPGRPPCELHSQPSRHAHLTPHFKQPEVGVATDGPLNIQEARLQALEAENKAQRETIEKLTAQLSKLVDGY